MVRQASFLFFTALIAGSYSTTSIEPLILNENWRVKGSNPEILAEIDVPATVPGGIYSDLMDNGVIGDVFSGSGDTEYRWIGMQEWTYYTNFTVDQGVLDKKSIQLVFEGLDTFATVSVNGVQVGTSQNMFVQYVYPVKEVLKVGSNTIEVVFQSPVNVSADLAAKEEYPLPPECPGDEANGICHVNQIRKMQASFSWDWGPALPSVGIWKNVSLEAFDTAIIRYVTTDTSQIEFNGTWWWEVSANIYFDAGASDGVEGNYTMSLTSEDLNVYTEDHIRVTVNDNQELVAMTSFMVTTDEVKLWWPNGYGSQELYALSVTFLAEGEVSSQNITIAFRTIELPQIGFGSSPNGTTFVFNVNYGYLPMFARGANKVPISILPEKSQDPAKITELLESVAAANMNMIRVWGGGVYESDFFYAEADRLGILIWQDMMFAGAYYPTYPEYLENVKQEVHHQVLRLRHHPCIALFGGNYENEWVVFKDAPGNITFYRSEYIKLFVDVVEAEIRRLAPNQIYIPSSPSNGVADEGDQILTADPSSLIFGDAHYFNYVEDSWDYRNFPVPRFASAFGYQSMPSLDTWLTATSNADDLNPDSDFVNHRQHHRDGVAQMTDLINMQLQLPVNDNSADYAATFIYYSQIVQAMSHKTAVEHYRTFQQQVEGDYGWTFGALSYQLNDVWVAPTWSSIDSTGSWKMLHYYAKNFYATNLVTAKIDDDGILKVYIVMDTLDQFRFGVRLDVQSYSQHEALSTTYYSSNSLLPFTAHVIAIENVTALLTAAGCGDDVATASRNCFFHLAFSESSDYGKIGPDNFLFPAKLKDSNLPRSTVAITAVTPYEYHLRKFDVTLESDIPALFVWLEAHGIPGTFDDNGLILIDPTYNVTFTSKVDTSADELLNALTVTHL